MITYSRLGGPHRGNLGNQLFQIAATIGIATRNGHEFKFPPWQYADCFARPWPRLGEEQWGRAKPLSEPHFHYRDPGPIAPGFYDLDGWRQSEKYWAGANDQVRDFFQFAPGLISGIRTRHAEALSRPCIAISIRRGDFVGNPNYWQIPALYYIQALILHFPDWRDHNVLIFSDDIPYCRVHFEGLPNVYFADGGPIDQLALMTQCRHFIVSNSTFSWWGAWLGEQPGSRVIRPNYLFDGRLKRDNDDRDYWPDRWTVFDHAGLRLDMRDVTFTIPVFVDHRHRQENIDLSVRMLTKDLETNIIICEQGSGSTASHHTAKPGVKWIWADSQHFHRTKMLNDMAKIAQTPIVVNWDCDVIVPPLQLWLAAESIRRGEADVVYPYDGRFARMPRTWHTAIAQASDIGAVRDTEFKGKGGKPIATTSVGGAIFFNRESFFLGGLENENMVSFGPEDWERNHRFRVLGYTIHRIDGALYHLDHWCGPDSSARNPFFRKNHAELDQVRARDPESLAAYVEAWPWRDLRYLGA